MKLRLPLAAVFFAIGLAAAWLAGLTGRGGEDGPWLFGVFAVFFLCLAAAPFLPAPKRKEKPEKVPATRFVPAWQMEGMILLTALLVVLGLLAHCLHPVR